MADPTVAAPVVPEVTEKKTKRGAKTPKAASVKVPKEKKATAPKKPKAKGTRCHPSFLEMISDAILTLKERTGSSQYAINKFVEDKHKQLPPNFRKLLLFHLKKLVASGKLVKVKNSFKLPSARAAPASAPAKKPTDSKTKVAAKPKPKITKVAVKPKAKVAAKAEPKTATAAKKKSAAKPKAKTAEKAKTATKPAKVAKTGAVSSPGKKKPVKKAVPAKKVKSVKSPAGKRARK